MEIQLCQAVKQDITNDTGAVRFPCPSCAKNEIIRSSFARKNAIQYTCACGFTGPN